MHGLAPMQQRPIAPILALLFLLALPPAQAVPERASPWQLVAEDCTADWPLRPTAASPDPPAAFSDAYDLVAVYAADAVANGVGVLRVAILLRGLEGEAAATAAHTHTIEIGLKLTVQDPLRHGVTKSVNTELTTHDGTTFAYSNRQRPDAYAGLSAWMGPHPSWETRPLQALVMDYSYAGLGLDARTVLADVGVFQGNDAQLYWPGIVAAETGRGDSLEPGKACDALFTLPPVQPTRYAPAAQPYALQPLPPLASASANRTTVQSGDPVAFHGTAAPGGGELDGVQWDFGDGTQSTSADATHAFAHPGAYPVTFTVREASDFFGRNATESIAITVVNAPPTAIATGPAMVKVGQDAEFKDKSTDRDGAIAARQWSFGDGATSSQRNVTHKFVHAGPQAVRLLVTDDAGATANATLTVQVTHDPPIASFAAPAAVSVGQRVNLTDASTAFEGSQVAAWRWTLDDHEIATTANTTLTLAAAGPRSVCLRVTDDQGAAADQCRTITARAARSSSNATDTQGGAGGMHTNSTSSSSSSYEGTGSQDGNQQDAQSARAAPAARPTFRILAPAAFAAGKPVQFLVEANGTFLAWAWSFGDGGGSTAKAPQHAYAEPGAYQVIATARGAAGVQAQATVAVTIQGNPASVAVAHAAPSGLAGALVGLALGLAGRRRGLLG
jgi:PKD repeat protein